MSESRQHYELVKALFNYIKKKVGNERECLIESDMIDGRPLPERTLEGFRPDVFYDYMHVMYIGEAKTEKDITREHSYKQYESFIKKCSLYSGKAEFVLAVPFTEYATAAEIIRKLRTKFPGDYKVRIIWGFV